MRKYSIILGWLFSLACSSPYRPDGEKNAARVQQILATADTYTGAMVARIPHFIDSAFRQIHHPSRFDMARKYDYLASCYFTHQKNHKKA